MESNKDETYFEDKSFSSSREEEAVPLLENFSDSFEIKHADKDLPKVSIVIPTCNCTPLISSTLESILNQDYPNFEVIVVDSSDDRTTEVIKGYRSEKLRIVSISSCKRYESFNKGLSLADGEYVNFLNPGDFYTYQATLKQMMSLAIDNDKPQMVYCGTILREARTEVKILYRVLTLDLLKNGQQPTSLQACWFRADALRKIGKFNPQYNMRGGFELMCRFFLESDFRFASIKRIFIDYDLRLVTRQMVITHFWETMKTIYHFFGIGATLRWLWHQKDIKRFIKLWIHSLKVAFSGR
ncbi:MAG: glycosyltransferase [Parachlamydiaceae bacterium]|nr:glycosyltransferase [Parachlamydiaceae bacterium]